MVAWARLGLASASARPGGALANRGPRRSNLHLWVFTDGIGSPDPNPRYLVK